MVLSRSFAMMEEEKCGAIWRMGGNKEKAF